MNAPHLLSSDVPLGHDRHVIGTFEESKDKMLEVLKMLLRGSNKVRCWSGHTNAQVPQANFAFLAQLHERQQPKQWSKISFPGVSLDAAGLIFLADLTTIAKHTALNGTSSFLDLFVLCPGIHRQQYATELNGGELPPTAALTSGYVFRIENQATVFYMQKMGVSGHLVTLRVEELKPGGKMPEPMDVRKAATLASLLYITPVSLTLTALAFVILMEDWWALAVLLILILARTLNAIVVKRRSVPGWKGVKEPSVKGDLLVLLSQDRWIRLQGPVDALKAVTAGQWLRDTTFWEGSLTAIATLLVYINAALTTNASQAGEITILALLLLSVGLVAMSNELQESLYMHGCRIHVDGEPKKYARRLDLANELIKYTGREDWAIRLGMINQKSDDTNTVKVVL